MSETANRSVTKLAYRIFRDGALLHTGAFADEGQHNVTVAKLLKREHRLANGDVISLDCGGYALCYQVDALGAQACARPEYVNVL
jgi:hypothetical protein